MSYIKETQTALVDTPMGRIPKTLHSTLVEGLTALCKAKPAGLDAIRYLGEWLVNNNPRNKAASSSVTEDVAESKGAESGAAASGVTKAAPIVVFVVGGDDGTSALCKRLAAQFGYSHIKSSDNASTAPATAVGALKEAMAKDGSRRFIIENFPHTLDQAFYFEKSVAQPLFVLLDGAEGPVADLYAKVGSAHAVEGSGESAYQSAAKYFFPKVVFALGLPGSGRTTVSNAIESAYGYRRLALDELVVAEAASGSVFGRSIAEVVAKGDQLPMDWVIRLFKEAMEGEPTGSYIIDGYPRTFEQARDFATAIATPKFVLLLDIPESESLRRGGGGAKKGIRVFKGRTQQYIDVMKSLGLVR